MQEIDVRDLPPPEPFEIIIKTLKDLDKGDSVKVIHRRIPYPLFEVIEKQGFLFEYSEISDGIFHIIITRGNS